MEKPVKILAVGNSFSEDTTFYLPQIAEAGGKSLILGRLYIGGCSLERHWTNVRTNEPVYEYHHTGRPDVMASISYGMKAADWDFMTFQQASHFSGMPETYHPFLENLSAYGKVLAPRAKQVIHETWAYAKDSAHPAFPDYGCDQEKMYACLKDAYQEAAKTILTDVFLPVGDAWQLAREQLGDVLCRDGFHGNEKGRYLGAAVWYEVLLNGNILENTFCPDGITEAELNVLKQCVRKTLGK